MLRKFASSLALSAALLLSQPACADDDLPYISSIAIERAPGETGAFAKSVAATLHVQYPARTALLLSRVDGLEVVASAAQTVTIESLEKPTIAGPVDERFLRESWVVDFDEPPVQALLRELAAGRADRPSVDELEHFVFDHISNKSYTRAFDLASKVAASGEGDCTEHAVLLAALARANAYPARIAFGNLIIEADSGLYAFGHAWTEIHDGERWQVRDATLPMRDPSMKQLRYLPIAILADEGSGYFLSLLDVMTTMPVRLSGMANR